MAKVSTIKPDYSFSRMVENCDCEYSQYNISMFKLVLISHFLCMVRSTMYK